MIQRLNENLVKQLKSSVDVSNVYDCLIQLIYNSIDADASNIQVKINMFTNDMVVTDNGCGITGAEMKLVGDR
jgi:DNA mismatch repair protein MLH3